MLDVDEFFRTLIDSPRRSQLLWRAWSSGQLNRVQLAALIGPVWALAMQPQRDLAERAWLKMFRAAGFTDNGLPAHRPTEPVRLYRGSAEFDRDNWHWTRNPAIAAGFAWWKVYEDGRIWTTIAPPQALLCRFDRIQSPICIRADHPIGVDWLDEWAINTEGLDIYRATDVRADAAKFGGHPVPIVETILAHHDKPLCNNMFQARQNCCRLRKEQGHPCCLKDLATNDWKCHARS